ncbi:MAG: hypothetical protein HOB26_11340 [Flavobacteriales bacterium]|nr:hypothetical protein [Flavobacteriales bacterium]MBT6747141.1 hypothetical protein [Flavobacteriales bacterium]
MALHYIFVFFFGVAFIIAVLRTLAYYFRDSVFELTSWEWILESSNAHVFQDIIQSTFDMSKVSVTICIGLIGAMTLWLGIMKIGEAGGAINILSKLVGPFFNKLFPELPKNHPASGSMLMNFSANMLGLDNAATPLGLKAMKQLQEVNTSDDTASNAQVMFLVLNTSGLTIVPVSVMAVRAANGAANPADVFLPILLATYFATIAGLIAVSIFQKINLFNKTILAYLTCSAAIVGGIIYFAIGLTKLQLELYSTFGGGFILFSIITSFIYLGMRNNINIYDTFIEGAKEGFQVAIKIIPYLVAMLVAIGVFRACGALDLLQQGLIALGLNEDVVRSLPTAMMKPLSGSGARGMMIEAIETYGPDSMTGRLTSVFQGSTETTFYTLAVYFGAVGIRKTRHAVTCGLIADAAGIIAAIFMAYLFFG